MWRISQNLLAWLVGCIEDLRRFSGILALKAGDNQSLKFKWRGVESNTGPLVPQAKSLTTRPPSLPLFSLGLRNKTFRDWRPGIAPLKSEIEYLLLPSCDMTEIMLKRRISSRQPNPTIMHVINAFWNVSVGLGRCFLDFSVGVGAFVIGLFQISSFFTCPQRYFHKWQGVQTRSTLHTWPQ